MVKNCGVTSSGAGNGPFFKGRFKMKTIMQATLKILGLIVLAIYFTACGGGGGGGGESSSAPTLKSPVTVVNPGAPVSGTTVSVTYRKLTKTTAPVSGWITKTITMTGACLDYQTRTYCWDDGLKTLTWVNNGTTYGPYRYNYWGLMVANPYGLCFGGCTSSLMTAPTFISAQLGNNILNSSNDTGNTINQVLNTGTPVAQTCTDDNGTLTCPDFTINLNQAAL
jgi:hypothetical protein